MENYISGVRPPQEIRHQLDIGYEIENQSIILNEIRPAWDDPKIIRSFGYAKRRLFTAKIFGRFIGNVQTINGICISLHQL